MPLLCASLTYSGVAIAQAEPMVFLTTYQAVGSSSRTASIITPKLEYYHAEARVLSRRSSKSFFSGLSSSSSSSVPAALPSFDLDPLTDLRPVTLLTATPDVLIVHAGLGINTLDELIAYAHEHPGERGIRSIWNSVKAAPDSGAPVIHL